MRVHLIGSPAISAKELKLPNYPQFLSVKQKFIFPAQRSFPHFVHRYNGSIMVAVTCANATARSDSERSAMIVKIRMTHVQRD